MLQESFLARDHADGRGYYAAGNQFTNGESEHSFKPNHQMVAVSVSVSASDNCDTAPASKIVSITCNETPSAGDIQITGNLTANLAATRDPSAAAASIQSLWPPRCLGKYLQGHCHRHRSQREWQRQRQETVNSGWSAELQSAAMPLAQEGHNHQTFVASGSCCGLKFRATLPYQDTHPLHVLPLSVHDNLVLFLDQYPESEQSRPTRSLTCPSAPQTRRSRNIYSFIFLLINHL